MAWIESHQELARHPKTKRLARGLGTSVPAAIGHLHLLWWWAMDYADSGVLDRYDAEDLADAAMWEGDPDLFVTCLERAGFIDKTEDGSLVVHDWDDYAGRLIEKRQAQADYKRRKYALYNDGRLTRNVKQRDGDTCQFCGKTVNWNDRRGADGGTYDRVDQNAASTPENTVVSCRACSADRKRQVSGKNTVDISAITVPNLTVPNLIPNSASDEKVTKLTRARPPFKGKGQEGRFDSFWAEYPKKKSKGQAERAWVQLNPDQSLCERIADGLNRAKLSQEWDKDDGQFIPYPATWLRSRGWEDDYKPKGPAKAQPSQRDFYVPPEILADLEGG